MWVLLRGAATDGPGRFKRIWDRYDCFGYAINVETNHSQNSSGACLTGRRTTTDSSANPAPVHYFSRSRGCV
jgi:hypothetical protein